jgi:hypothetical protein
MMFLDCPAYLDDDGAGRCGLPAEVRSRFTARSSDGPLECAMIRCPVGHWFNGPIESLTLRLSLGARGSDQPPRGRSVPAGARGSDQPPRGRSVPRRDQRPADRSMLDGTRGRAVRAPGGRPEQVIGRPAGAPPYYLGRPAWLWITAMTPHRGRAAEAPVDAPAPASVPSLRRSRGAALTQAR